MWWIILRDFLMLSVGLTGIAYEHYTPDDARHVLVIVDLILIGLIPLNHLVARIPRVRIEASSAKPPPPPPPPPRRAPPLPPSSIPPRPPPR